jgi:WD40 repeat protein
MRCLVCLAMLGVACHALGADPAAKAPLIAGLAFSPSGKYLVATSGELDNTGHVTVWQMPAGTLVAHHQEPKGVPTAVFSPDETKLALGSFLEQALVMDTATWKIERRLPGKASRALAFSPDSKTLAAGTQDGALRLWDAATWSVRKTLTNAHSDMVFSVAFSRDGTILASGGDALLKIWDAATGKSLHVFPFEHYIRHIVFTADDRHIIYSGLDGCVAVRVRQSGQAVGYFERFGANYYALGGGLDVSASGDLLAISSEEAKVLPLDLKPADQAAVEKIRRLMKGWDDPRMAVREQASKDIAALGMPALAELRKIINESPVPEVRLRARLTRSAILAPSPILAVRHAEGEIQSVALSPDSQVLATGGTDGTVRLWSLASHKELRVLRQVPATGKVPRSEY